jgi:hypothetical protein
MSVYAHQFELFALIVVCTTLALFILTPVIVTGLDYTNRLSRYVKFDLYDKMHVRWFEWKTTRDSIQLNFEVRHQERVRAALDAMNDIAAEAERGLQRSQAEYALFSGAADVPEPVTLLNSWKDDIELDMPLYIVNPANQVIHLTPPPRRDQCYSK